MKNKWIWIVLIMFFFGFVARECARIQTKTQYETEKAIDAYKATPASIKEAMKKSRKNGIENISQR